MFGIHQSLTCCLLLLLLLLMLPDHPLQGSAAMARSVSTCQKNNIRISCTVNVNDDKFCVQNGGSWEDCRRGSSPDALMAYVCGQYTGTKPAECSKVAA